MIYCFSGTGNSLNVARQLAERLSDNIIRITPNTSFKIPTHADEPIGLVFPVYGWGIPKIVEHFIKQIPSEGLSKNTYIYGILTCGDDIGCTDKLLYKALKSKGLKLSATHSIQLRNTYICLPGFNTDSPELEEKKENIAVQQIKRIAKSISLRLSSTPADIHPGAWPRLKSYVLRPLFNRFLTDDSHFHVDTDLCTHCGLCINTCPIQNITASAQNGTPQWNGKCTHCLACYHSCPKHAISYGPFTKGKRQVKVKLK